MMENFSLKLHINSTNSSTQYLSVLDPSTDKIIYEGKIMIRPDQGLVNNYQLKTVNQD